ncbi:MAG: hypothetical protein JWO00_324 [Candidatus Parcubacteria bacterium]|nr:hypothetical protein [Candidatus Parcubacteria bacterium]
MTIDRAQIFALQVFTIALVSFIVILSNVTRTVLAMY